MKSFILATLATACMIGSSPLYAVDNQRIIEDEVVYFLFTDRFSNGDTSNDQGDKSDPLSFGGFDPTHKSFFHGGDFRGILDKLGYLKELGITAVWITPVLKNVATQDILGTPQGAYHGYWIVDFTSIDPHLGSEVDLQQFMTAAKALGIKVFFDVVANHTADIITYSSCDDKKASDANTRHVCAFDKANQKRAYIPSGAEHVKTPLVLNALSNYHNNGDIQNWDNQRQVELGDLAQLDDLDFSKPEVRKTMIDVHQSLIKKFKPDGFRIDSVKHVPMDFWEDFAKAMKAAGREHGIEFFNFAEVYTPEGPEVLSRHMKGTALDSVLDFRFKGVVNRVFGQGDKPSHLMELFRQDIYYNTETKSANQLMNFVSNHDYGRLGMGIARGLSHEPESVRLGRFIQAQAFMILARGVPVIYYGDEQGFSSDGSYENSREDMFPSRVAEYNRVDLLGTDKTTADDNFDTSHPIYQKIKELNEVYHKYPALRRGVFQPQLADDQRGLFVFTRRLNDEVFWVVFNSGKQAVGVQPHLPAGDVSLLYASSPGDGTEVPALSYAIFKQRKAAPAAVVTQFTFGDLPRISSSATDVHWTYNVSVDQKSPDLTIKTYLSTNGKDFVLGTWDDSWPYQAYVDKKYMAGHQKIHVRTELWLANKLKSTGSSNISIDDRTPAFVQLQFQPGGQSINELTTLSDDGLVSNVKVTGSTVKMDWGTDRKHLTVFPKHVPATGDVTFFKPIHIHARQFLGRDVVWDGAAAVVKSALTPIVRQDADAPYPDALYLRGSLNGWGLDALTWDRKASCYTSLISWHGEAQWKVADKTWGRLNIGNPGGELGLSDSGMPTNLTHWFPLDSQSKLSICVLQHGEQQYIIPHID